jgi:hypothetical protein
MSASHAPNFAAIERHCIGPARGLACARYARIEQ